METSTREPGVPRRDQDSGDCGRIKSELQKICERASKPDALIRIACRELEAWYFGDLATVANALDAPQLAGLVHKAAYRDPDAISAPSKELERLIPGFGKVGAAAKVGAVISTEATRSTSFGHLLAAIEKLVRT